VQVVDPEEKRLEVIVEDTQLSLAIGKKGQNVRLASKLIGWNIDIKSEEEKRREIEAQMAALTAPGTPLTELQGVGPKTIEKLEAAGITSVEKLADMTPEQLVEIPGIGEKMVEKIHQSVAAYFEALEAQALAAPEPSAETLEAGGQGTAESPEKPEGPGEVQETPEAGEPSDAPEVGEVPEISEEPETGEASQLPDSPEKGEASETSDMTSVRDAETLDSPEGADTRELPGEETPRHSVEGGEETEGSEENVEK
jgi:N utilization substance protein A